MTGVPLRPAAEWDDETHRVLTSYLRRPEVYADGKREMPKALQLFAQQVPVGAAWLGFSDLLSKQAELDPPLAELAILRVAWRARSAYEWAQHTRMALAAGLTTAHLHAVPDGADAEIWTPLQRLVVTAVDQIVDGQTVDDTTSEALAGHLPPGQHLELLFVIGSYLCLAGIMNAARLVADPPTEPVDAPPLPPA